MRIALVGDVMLGRLVNEQLKGAAPSLPWGDTLPVLRQADLRVANLECVLADGGQPVPGKVFHFRSDTKNVDCLRAADINIVSLANNHVLDFGVPALAQMLPALDRYGILHSGAGLDREAARRPAIWRRGTATVGFIAVTDNEPGWAAQAQTPGVHYVPVDPADRRAAELLELVRATKAAAGILIVSAHWGPNWGSEVPAAHQGFAHALVDAGADVVFGHSAHIVRGVELYRARPIIYSAGDFVDDYAVDPVERNDRSFIFVLETDGTVVRSLRLHPTLIAGFQARLAGARSGSAVRREESLCKDLGTSCRWLEKDNALEILV